MRDRALLMIPGPIEFESEVLQALGAPTSSHVAPEFIEVFGQALERMREVWLCPSGQPFVVSGSGMLALEMAVANLIESGDKTLVLSTGVFGDRYADLLRRYHVEVSVLRAPLGKTIPLQQVEETLKEHRYKLMTITHVDTSTGVRTDAKFLAAIARKYDTLTVLDGVCSVAGEELRQEEWGIDVVLTASQKAIGVPPGLALMIVSPRAIETWRRRKTPVSNYYADWGNWLPIMEAYEARKASYFATPPVNLICALNVSLERILKEGMETRFERHKRFGAACKAGIQALGLEQVPTDSAHAAATLTAPYYPRGITGSEFLPKVKDAGVILAGGLHPDIKGKYFRIGHMGAETAGDLLATIGAIEAGLQGCGYTFELGAGVRAAQHTLRG
ncbi:MAG TPA: alanine--glyoxylate aminotransferase family protein [Candidatus Acetothermia bacterium]|nr:alanine--glyoxylate aminotransferase family protein [Candidatus Acetothermia bacterium]